MVFQVLWILYNIDRPKVNGRGALFAASVSLKKGGVERKLSLDLVRSFFALSIGDNIRCFSQSSLGGYHWLRTRRLLRLQKANSSLAPLPLLPPPDMPPIANRLSHAQN